MIMINGMFGHFGRPGLDTDMHIGPVHSHLNEYYKKQEKLERNNIRYSKSASAHHDVCTDLHTGSARLKTPDVGHEG